MNIRRALILLLAVALTAPAFSAQTPKTAPPAAPPQISQVDQLEIQNIQLRYQILQTEEDQLRVQYAALTAQIAKENPGYLLDPKTNQLVKAQTAPPNPTKK